MKRSVLFYQPDKCTGCLLCEMACSLGLSGACGRGASLIHVLTHPRLGTSQPLVSEQCEATECDLRCIQSCSGGVLRWAPESKWAELLAGSEWVPVPILPDRLRRA